jgi:hypothetical protein
MIDTDSIHSTKHDSLGRAGPRDASASQREPGGARSRGGSASQLRRCNRAGGDQSTFRVLLKLARGLRVPLSELLELVERRHRETYREPLGSLAMRRPFTSTAAHLREPGKVIPFQRPVRPPTSPAPEHLLRATEASLRASDVYPRLLNDRLELARTTHAPAGLGRLDGAALLRVAAASDALQRAAQDALAQIEPQLANRARLVAGAAREIVPGVRMSISGPIRRSLAAATPRRPRALCPTPCPMPPSALWQQLSGSSRIATDREPPACQRRRRSAAAFESHRRVTAGTAGAALGMAASLGRLGPQRVRRLTDELSSDGGGGGVSLRPKSAFLRVRRSGSPGRGNAYKTRPRYVKVLRPPKGRSLSLRHGEWATVAVG